MLSPKLLTKYFILHNLGPFLVVAVDHVHSLTYRLESGRKGGRQGQISSKLPKFDRNPVEKVILVGSRALGQEAENCHKDQIYSKWPKLGRNPIDKAILEGFWDGSGPPGQEAEHGHQQTCRRRSARPSVKSNGRAESPLHVRALKN